MIRLLSTLSVFPFPLVLCLGYKLSHTPTCTNYTIDGDSVQRHCHGNGSFLTSNFVFIFEKKKKGFQSLQFPRFLRVVQRVFLFIYFFFFTINSWTQIKVVSLARRSAITTRSISIDSTSTHNTKACSGLFLYSMSLLSFRSMIIQQWMRNRQFHIFVLCCNIHRPYISQLKWSLRVNDWTNSLVI